MAKGAFDKIAAGLNDAIAFAEGDTARGKIAAGPDIKAIRGKAKLSQAAFAEKLGHQRCHPQGLEQGRRMLEGSARTLLGMVDADPDAAFKACRAKVAVATVGIHDRRCARRCSQRVWDQLSRSAWLPFRGRHYRRATHKCSKRLRFTKGRFKTNFAHTCIKTLKKWLLINDLTAGMNRNNFINTIAKKIPTVKNRYFGFISR